MFILVVGRLHQLAYLPRTKKKIKDEGDIMSKTHCVCSCLSLLHLSQVWKTVTLELIPTPHITRE